MILKRNDYLFFSKTTAFIKWILRPEPDPFEPNTIRNPYIGPNIRKPTRNIFINSTHGKNYSHCVTLLAGSDLFLSSASFSRKNYVLNKRVLRDPSILRLRKGLNYGDKKLYD